MFKNIFSKALVTFLFLIFFAVPMFASQEDPCKKEGIVVRNATMLDLWFTRNDGECFIWIHEHLFTIESQDSIVVYSDMNCQTLYCADNPTYKDYKSVDVNENCRVKILPDCSVSDM